MHVWIAGAVAALLFGASVTPPPPSAQAPPSADAKKQSAPTPNDELIKLAIAGMGEDILLAVIAKTDKAKYDTSADALLKLKSAGINERVMAAILGIPPPAAAAVPPMAAPAPNFVVPPRARPTTAPQRPGAALLVNEDPYLPTTAEANAATNLRFSVFISAPQRDGFFDTTKDIQDSIKNLRDKLSKEKDVNLTITDDRKNADVILTVVQRGKGNQAYGRRVEFQEYYGGASLEQVPMIATSYWVSTMMQVGTYKKEFTGVQTQDDGAGSSLTGATFTMGAWSKCAGLIAVNIGSWTRTNAVLMNHYKNAAAAPK
jgi:hypothetical protein